MEIPSSTASFPDDARPKPFKTRLVLGMVIIAFGVLLTLDNFHLLPRMHLWQAFWGFVILGFGFGKLWERSFFQNGFWPALLWCFVTLTGVGMFLDSMNQWDFDLHRLWPIALVILGAGIAWRAIRPPVPPQAGDHLSSGVLNELALFGGKKRKIVSSSLRGGEITAIFGGHTLDFTEAQISPDSPAVIDVFTMFGGGEIRVPPHVSVIIKSTSIFGGIEDKTQHPAPDSGAPELVFTGWILFGGLEIKN